MSWRVFVDFDGTITLGDVTNSILDRFAPPSWRSIEDEWQRGDIGSRACMARQVDLIRATAADLDGFVAEQAIDPTFPAFVEDCRRWGVPLAVVSDGLDRVVETVLRRIGCEDLPWTANRLVQTNATRWRLQFPHSSAECRSLSGNCKCASVQPDRPGRGRKTILVGDGRSDLCAAHAADVVFAKKDLLRLCRERAVPCVQFEHFDEVGDMLAGWLKRAVPAKALAEELSHA